MSTRSGKRIHSSLHENESPNLESAVKNERKRRSKRVKEDVADLNMTLENNMKRNNYVSYPTDDEQNIEAASKDHEELKFGRVLRKNALREQNVRENIEAEKVAQNLIRKSRRFKKLSESHVEETENLEIVRQPKSKKTKKGSQGGTITCTETIINTTESVVPSGGEPVKKSRKKKRKGKKTSPIIVEDIPQNDEVKDITNKSNMSVESFHSAAGSPQRHDGSTHIQEEETKIKTRAGAKYEAKMEYSSMNVSQANNETHSKITKKRKGKAVSNDTTFDKSNVSVTQTSIVNDEKVNKTFDKGNTRKTSKKDTTFDKSNVSTYEDNLVIDNNSDLNTSTVLTRKSRSSIKNATFDKSSISLTNGNIDMESCDSIVSKKALSDTFNKTYEKPSPTKKIPESEEITNINVSSNKKPNAKDTTFDKDNMVVPHTDIDMSLNVSNISNKQLRSGRSSIKNSTFDKTEKVVNTTFDKTDKVVNTTFDKTDKVVNTTFGKTDKVVNTTFEKDKVATTVNVRDVTFDKTNTGFNSTFEKDVESEPTVSKTKKNCVNNETYEKNDKTNDTFDKEVSASFDKFKKGALNRKSSIRDATFDKSNTSIASLTKEDFERDRNISSSSAYKRNSLKIQNDSVIEEVSEKSAEYSARKSLRKSQSITDKLNTTFDRGDVNKTKSDSKSSLISSDNSNVTEKSVDMSRISITSDDTTENIVNTTPLLIESSMEESLNISKQKSPVEPQTPLKREGTFTKEVSEVIEKLETPTKRKSSIPEAGCTPYHVAKSSQKKRQLNVTRSIEKGRLSLDPAPTRMTRVMFCSPVDNPVIPATEKRKVIKSNLKGSSKSFVFEENATVPRPARKRSYTQNDADDARAKRSCLTEDLQHSVDRLSRPRTPSATGKLTESTPTKKQITPSRSKSEGKPARTKLPNFAALHQRQFAKMESLDECQERRAKRAKQLLTPTGAIEMLERISPKNAIEQQVQKKPEPSKTKDKTEKTDTPTKKLPTLESLRPGFTRFGFKLNLDVNPFSIPSKTAPVEKPKVKPNGLLKPGVSLPSLAGTTLARRDVAKQTVMREKSFTDRRNVNRKENRTIIKGVRTNRRFDLQMKMRNID